MDLREFGEQLICVHIGYTLVVVNPANQLSEGDAQGVVKRSISADGHDVLLIFKARPVDLLALDHMHLNTLAESDFQRCACDFTISLHGMSITHEEHGAGSIYGKIDGVAGAGFRRIHVAAECFRNNRAARLTACGRYTNAA